MEEALRILDFLPLSYKEPTEQAYMEFLRDSFITNYEAEKFQFAFIAYHMLYMSFIYFVIWQVKNDQPEIFEKSLIGFSLEHEKLLLADNASPFILSRIKEASALRFLKLMGCRDDLIGQLKKSVTLRNHTAHSNGHLYINSKETLDGHVEEILRVMRKVQEQSEPFVLSCYERFLYENRDPDKREYSVDEDQIREILIHRNYFSETDIRVCLGFDIKRTKDMPRPKDISRLHNKFLSAYGDVA